MIWRKAHAMHEQLTFVERTQDGRQGIAEANHANQRVIDGICDGDVVGKLFGGVDTILVADWDIGIGGGAGSLSGLTGWGGGARGGDTEKRGNSRVFVVLWL